MPAFRVAHFFYRSIRRFNVSPRHFTQSLIATFMVRTLIQDPPILQIPERRGYDVPLTAALRSSSPVHLWCIADRIPMIPFQIALYGQAITFLSTFRHPQDSLPTSYVFQGPLTAVSSYLSLGIDDQPCTSFNILKNTCNDRYGK